MGEVSKVKDEECFKNSIDEINEKLMHSEDNEKIIIKELEFYNERTQRTNDIVSDTHKEVEWISNLLMFSSGIIFIILALSLFISIKCVILSNDVKAMKEQLVTINQSIDEMEILYETKIEEMERDIVNEIENAKSEIIADNYGTFKSFMYYTSLSSSSKQGQIQKTAYTDENGLRKIGNMYIIATGSYYGNVGDILEVTLSNGNSFLAVKGDMKADKDTDENNQICVHDGSVIEFIVDKENLYPLVKKLGDVSALEFFKGSISSIEVIAHEI